MFVHHIGSVLLLVYKQYCYILMGLFSWLAMHAPFLPDLIGLNDLMDFVENHINKFFKNVRTTALPLTLALTFVNFRPSCVNYYGLTSMRLVNRPYVIT